jgi:phage terminase large subunit
MSTRLWPVEHNPVRSAWKRARREAATARQGQTIAHEDYQTRPIDWIVEKLGVPRESLVWTVNEGYDAHTWDGDPDPLVRVAEALAAWEDVGVESGTGTGKSFFLACLVLWFLACWKGARVFTLAPKEDQLRLYAWMEIGKLWSRFRKHFPAAELTDLRIRMEGTDEWGAWGYSVAVKAGEDSATNAQGMHAEHMLLIYEETPGIHPSVLAAGENTCTAPHNLRIAVGNPDHQHDTLHKFCTSPGVRAVRMSSLDHPNVVTDGEVVPGAVSRKAVERRRLKYGEDSRLYQSRVRGISPAEAEDALIRWAWCEEAAKRWGDERFREGPPAIGVDVANSENGDKAAIARWQGACLTEVESFACPDASVLGKRVADEARATGVDARNVGVDSVGVGASTVNKMKELGLKPRALNGGQRAIPMLDETLLWGDIAEEDGKVKAAGPKVIEEERYNNLRSQMWWQMRDDLRLGRIALPHDEELWRDLTTPTYTTRGGKIVVESKEDLFSRLKRSPDKGDAAIYGNFVRRRRPVARPAAPPKDPNVDTGLEKLFDRHAKQQAAEKRQVDRFLRSLRKGKR